MKVSRREALKGITGASMLGLIPSIDSIHTYVKEKQPSTQTFKHSVCRWPYSGKTLEELCEAAVDIGIDSVELLNPEDFDTIKRYGLTCAMANSVPLSLTDGFNDPSLHEKLQNEYFELIPIVAEAGFDKIICFSGNRKGWMMKPGLNIVRLVWIQL